MSPFAQIKQTLRSISVLFYWFLPVQFGAAYCLGRYGDALNEYSMLFLFLFYLPFLVCQLSSFELNFDDKIKMYLLFFPICLVNVAAGYALGEWMKI